MNKRTAIIITDIHLRPDHDHLEWAQKLFLKTIKEIKEKKPTYLFILGDIFHYKNRLFASCLRVFRKFLEEVSELCEVICLVGNHDWGVPYEVHSLDTFRTIPNVKIVDDYYRLDENNVFISYCRESERFNEHLAILGPAKRLYGHLDINSFKVGSGWEEVDAYSKPEDFAQFEQVFSGHLHLAQESKLSNGTQIVFVGTGYTTDFGESDQEKRMILLDIDTGEFDSISTEMTLHKTLRIKASDPFPIIPETEVLNGVNYRVIVSGTREQLALTQKPKNYPATIIFEFMTTESPRADLSVSDTRQETLSKYIDYEIDRSFKGEAESLDKELLKKKGNDILNKFN